MGACGCGDYDGRWRFPGPDGMWYVVGVYGGCSDCQTPAGVSIDLMGPDEMESWDAQSLPIVGGPDNRNFGFPVIDHDRLERAILDALVKECGAHIDEDDEEYYFDGGVLYGVMRRVSHATADDFEIKRREFEARRRGRD